jgi:hypothetical protein
MNVCVELPNDILTKDDLDRLRALLGRQDDDALQPAVESLIRAGLAEYKEMLLRIGLPSRAVEISEHRLFCLIQHYFKDHLPTEGEVASMFHLTESASRSLLHSVIAKYENYLERQLKETLKAAVRKMKFDPTTDIWIVVIQSDNVLRELNRIIESQAPDLSPVSKIRGEASTYTVTPDAHKVLAEALGV